MREPPHRLAPVIRALVGLVLLVAPASPLAPPVHTGEAEVHHVQVVEAAQPQPARARRRPWRSERRVLVAPGRAIVSLRPVLLFGDPPLPPLRV